LARFAQYMTYCHHDATSSPRDMRMLMYGCKRTKRCKEKKLNVIHWAGGEGGRGGEGRAKSAARGPLIGIEVIRVGDVAS
jgi:hypothetical protein